MFHIAAVEDLWLHEDILRDPAVWASSPGFPEAFEGPYYDALSLGWMLDYGRAVEASTLGYLEGLSAPELAREVTVESPRGNRVYTVEELLWHVWQHEVRHTAQIALLTRRAGYAPPQLDLIRYSGRAG